MPLSQEMQVDSLEDLKNRYKKLSPQQIKLLDAVNTLAANNNVRLKAQSDAVLKLLGSQLKQSFDESSISSVASSIYSMIGEQMDRETDENRRKHRAQGHFDQKYIHQRSIHDELQDHDMTLLMPKSHGDIEVLAPANRFDPGAINASQEGITLALNNKKIKHILISIGPGHWRGIYLTKPNEFSDKYELELFDPYGPSGADAIRNITLDILKKCGINEYQITIKLTGPTHPQQDGYACGDFTYAYSHKKMKDWGAFKTAYNQQIITVLEDKGNEGDALRHASREESRKQAGPAQISKQTQFEEREKQEFLRQLDKILSDPNQMDKAVLDGKIAKIKNTSRSEFNNLSLRELDAYGVFNADGSLNTSVATEYGIKFDESRVQTRLKSSRFKEKLSFREKLILESALCAVEQEYIKSNKPSKGLAEECLNYFWPNKFFIFLKNPLSMELSGPARDMFGMGYFKFKDTNISISPGPYAAKSLIPSENPELYQVDHDIAGYLNHLLRNNVTHVFAMGRVLPYHPKEGIGDRKLRKDKVVDDFINYFIPDANGRVRLPDVPELKDVHITSRPIKKVGRFITYEISINGSNPIQIDHFPIHDKQPLELTPEELSYVKKIGQLPEQNIHTHCRGGKGRSAQIAYILASLNPKYSRLNPKQRLAQMRAEKTTADELQSFIETPLQETHIESIEDSIQKGTSSEAVSEDKHFEIYIIYGTLLKQLIDQYTQKIDSLTEENKARLELMEKYQTLSATPLDQLDNWVKEVCENPLMSESTKAWLNSVNFDNNSTDFLLNAFAAKTNPQELELFFDLQARNGSYQDLLDKLEEKMIELSKKIDNSTEEGKIAIEQLGLYQSLFIAHIQAAHLKNFGSLDEVEQIPLRVETGGNISDTITEIFVALVDPKSLTKEKFNQLQKEYSQCKPRLELLEKVESQDEVKVLTEEVKHRNKIIEQLFILGYEHFEVEPSRIILKMNVLYQQLGELSSTNKLSPVKWSELKRQFTALKIIYELNKSEEKTPRIVSTLDKLFQGTSEHPTSLFQEAVLQIKPEEKNLDDFVADLAFAILNAASEKLPKQYFEEDGFYFKEIEQLIKAISKLADTYSSKKTDEIIDLRQPRKIPTAKEYEEARQKVIQLIPQHIPIPFLISTNEPRVQVESLHQQEKPPLVSPIEEHRKSIEKAKTIRNMAHERLKEHFAKFKEKYKHLSNNDEVVVNELAEPTLSLYKEERRPLVSPISESMENILKIQAMRDATKSGTARRIQDEIDYVAASIEEKSVKTALHPKVPKLIIFDVDDTLIDLEKNELKRAQELINVLNYAKKHGIEVAIATNRTQGLDELEPTPVKKLKEMIHKETEIDISNMLTFLDTPSLRLEKDTIFRTIQGQIDKLKQEITVLRSKESTGLDKEKLTQDIEQLQQKIDSLQKKSDRLISGKFMHLDSIRRHYHGLKNLTNYYQTVEGGILQDFKNPKLTINIGISDFKEKEQAWDNLFYLAEKLMDSKSAQKYKFSFHTILKDLIFDAHRPEFLKEKYSDGSDESDVLLVLRKNELIEELNANREYFIQNLPHIESFYQSRLAYRKYKYEKNATLSEEDVLFLDDNENIITQTQQSNYRVIKVSNPSEAKENSFRYMVEFNYEIGAYNGVIKYLIRKTPENYSRNLNDNLIPNFTAHEFRHSPIVLTVKISTILDRLPGLSKEEAVQKRYKEQFFEAALERYLQLPKELEHDFVTTYYRDAHETLKKIEQKLQELIQYPPEDPEQLRVALYKLKAQVDEVISMDEKFSQRISPTFLDSEAKLLRSMIIGGIFSNNLSSLTVENGRVQFVKDHDNTRTMFYTESIKQLPNFYYLQKVHPALKEINVFDSKLISKQYTHLISKLLKEAININIEGYAPFSVLHLEVAEKDYPSFVSLLHTLQYDITEMDVSTNDTFENHRQLVAAEKLCNALEQIALYQNIVDDLEGKPQVDYQQQITNLSQQITTLKRSIESSEQYKAKLFLDEADRYLRAKDWNVGLQWNSHTIEVDGKKKKIPATVAEQLKIIEQAQKDNNYVTAKEQFLKIGKEKEISSNSSKTARSYYSLFKNKDKSFEKNLENEFSPTKKA
ncbi:hypothetical protein [Fluoribacter gormanii]|uniref:Legionella ubiquitin-specific protease A domain-containing protein n=1 Tax=Fluoribacter gormanii TaxID=464 RepID=A0A377GFU5_9GAMM|nr:hypothetical protein [Fluoribacter gormanii]KTD02915.1 substrate of the Dot/Icm secretion system [Fluoribacter gormanii]SIR85222.1 hypothetical protein SAMN05421777_1303 [Fluoribacter gormanii]STO23699.1 Uncharacterised protein [Fluoribacter gormanii]